MSLKNKVAIVTGGNTGIGQAIVLALAKQGANIVIDYVAHPEATEALEREVAGRGDQCIGVDADVSKIADLQKLVDAAVNKFGHLDVMVNNAGIETRTSVLDTTEDQYDAVMHINLSPLLPISATRSARKSVPWR
jgi:glucose 1-dehydrogenase